MQVSQAESAPLAPRARQRLNAIQWVRAFAAMAVVLYHIEAGVNDYARSENFYSLFSWGHYGVEVFFCLSGFVIAYSAWLKSYTPWSFLYGRLARLYPTYLFVATLFALSLLLLPSWLIRSGQVFTWKELVDTLMFNYGTSGGYVYVGWSLFYEFIFYVVFALLVQNFSKICRTSYFHYASSLCLWAFLAAGADRVSLFVVGVCVFLTVVNPSGLPAMAPPRLAVLAACFGSASLSLPVFFCFLGFSLLLLLERKEPAWVGTGFFVEIGDASYSIYLIQVLTLSACIKAISGLADQVPFGLQEALEYPIIYVLSIVSGVSFTIVLGLFMRRFIEKPSFDWLMLRWHRIWPG